MMGETRERFSRYFNLAGRKRFADAIANCTKPASHRRSKRPRIVASFAVQRSLGTLPCWALRCGATAIRCYPAVTFAQNLHRPGNLREPYERYRPPNFARQLDGRIRAAVTPSIAQQKLHFFHQVFMRQAKQFRYARILQWRQRHPTALHEGRQPARNARAEFAISVPE